MNSAAPDNLHSQPGEGPGRALSGKHAIVTGAAGCIGRATAIRLAEMGANLTLVDIEPDGLDFVDDLDSGDHKSVVVDLGSREEIRRYCADQLSAGGADILQPGDVRISAVFIGIFIWQKAPLSKVVGGSGFDQCRHVHLVPKLPIRD